ncbi:hypothetical protein Tco_0726784 [Tanacetum coccineum]|uniref:Uncharacterized protein n=1 Tax=Tanacetum coccineum TaxID=301880 RepID=A0ABQ4YGJ5_9ASTR
MYHHRDEPRRQNVGNISIEVKTKSHLFPFPFLSYKYHLISLKLSNLNPTTKVFQLACSLPHADYEVEDLVQRLINEDKGHQDALLELAFRFEDSCAVRDDLRKAYEKCTDISQESRVLICTFLKESSGNDHKLHLSMYGKASQLKKQMGANVRLAPGKKVSPTEHAKIIFMLLYIIRPQQLLLLTEKELHQLRMDEEALREMLEEEGMNKRAQEEKIRQK